MIKKMWPRSTSGKLLVIGGVAACSAVIALSAAIAGGGSRSATAAPKTLADRVAPLFPFPASSSEAEALVDEKVTSAELAAGLSATEYCMEQAGVTPISPGDPSLDGQLQLAWRVLPGQDLESARQIANDCARQHSAHLQAAFAMQDKAGRSPQEEESIIKTCLRGHGVSIDALNGEIVSKLMRSEETHQVFVDCANR